MKGIRDCFWDRIRILSFLNDWYERNSLFFPTLFSLESPPSSLPSKCTRLGTESSIEVWCHHTSIMSSLWLGMSQWGCLSFHPFWKPISNKVFQAIQSSTFPVTDNRQPISNKSVHSSLLLAGQEKEYLLIHFSKKVQFFPVEPNPPAPLSVPSSSYKKRTIRMWWLDFSSRFSKINKYPQQLSSLWIQRKSFSLISKY